jgi:hypothetical protein
MFCQSSPASRINVRCISTSLLLLIANAGLIHRTVEDAPRSSARLVALWLAGLISPEILIEVPPPPTEPQIRRALHK